MGFDSFGGDPVVNVHFSSKILDYQALRAMSYTTFGGAEPGEVLATVERVGGNDTEDWFDEWHRTANRVAALADEKRDEGHTRSARNAYLRAHNYYRTAEFFLPPDDDRRPSTYEASVDAFRSGTDLLDVPPEVVSFPFEDTELPGYLFLPELREEIEEPFSTVVCLGGFDSICEELYFACGVPEALARGYAVVLFEGPGQGSLLREAGVTARPDWEHVVGPVLDSLETDDAIDPDRVALVGLSYGGYYAPRAAAFEDRIAACVAFDHMHDLYRAAAADSPRAAAVFQRVPDWVIDATARVGARFSVDSRWLMQNSRWVFGIESASELMDTLQEYSLADDASNITCPTLVLAGEDDHFVPVELASEFAELVGGPTTLRVFETETGAAEHCQMGNLRLATATIYDWLDEIFA